MTEVNTEAQNTDINGWLLALIMTLFISLLAPSFYTYGAISELRKDVPEIISKESPLQDGLRYETLSINNKNEITRVAKDKDGVVVKDKIDVRKFKDTKENNELKKKVNMVYTMTQVTKYELIGLGVFVFFGILYIMIATSKGWHME